MKSKKIIGTIVIDFLFALLILGMICIFVKPKNDVVSESKNTITGKYMLGEMASCTEFRQNVNFTYGGESFVGIRSAVNADGDPITEFVRANNTVLVVQCMGGWQIDITKTIDFGFTSQTVSEEFLEWVSYSLVKQN